MIMRNTIVEDSWLTLTIWFFFLCARRDKHTGIFLFHPYRDVAAMGGNQTRDLMKCTTAPRPLSCRGKQHDTQPVVDYFVVF